MDLVPGSYWAQGLFDYKEKKLIVENKRRMDSQRLQRRSSTSEGGGDDKKIHKNQIYKNCYFNFKKNEIFEKSSDFMHVGLAVALATWYNEVE